MAPSIPMDRSSDLIDRTSSSRAKLALMTLSSFTQHAEQSDSASWSPPPSWIRSATPRNRSQERPHEIDARASRFDRVAYRPFRGLPWAQGVAGSNPVAPTTSRLRLCNGCATGSGKGACLGALFVVRRPSQNPRQPAKQRQTHRGVTGGVKHRDGHAVMVQHRMDEHRSRKRFRAETGGAALEGGATATGAQ